MKKLLFSLIFLFAFFALYTVNVNAGDRNILVERFTSSTCGPCAFYNPTLDAYLNSSDPDKITNISYHMSWPSPGNDPMYLINPSDNNARRTLYAVNAIPDWYFDGLINIQIPNTLPPLTGILQAAFNSRTNLLSPVSLVVKENVNGNNVVVNADIYCEGLAANPNVTIQMAVVEQVVYYNGPNGENHYLWVLRKFLPNASGIPATILPGSHVSVEQTYTMDPAWDPTKIKTLVFVQSTSADKEILNCAFPTTNFNLVSNPSFKVINLGQAGSENFNINIPNVADGYNSAVTFSYEVVPANAGITATFPNGNVISSFPNSLVANVSSTANVPVGEYKIVFTGTDTQGKTHKTFVNYLVGKNYVSVENSRSSLAFKVDNISYTSKKMFTWDLNSSHTIEAVSPQTFGNNRYIFNNWSNGGSQTQTITIGTDVSEYVASYDLQYRMLGLVSPSGLPVSISGSGSFFDSASVNDITVTPLQVQHNGKTYQFSGWTGVGSGSYTGSNPVASITMNGFIAQTAKYDTIDVGISNYNSTIPNKFSLYQNYPNPFNPTTNIKFDVANSTHTSLVIYDMLGKEITKLVNQVLTPGSYQYTFNAANYPSGMYYYKIKTDGFTEIRKMILLK